MILAGPVTGVGSNISQTSTASALTSSVTLGTHATGDYLIAIAGNSDGDTITIPSGWIEIVGYTAGRNYDAVVAYKVAASSGETSGTWTNATRLVIAAYDGVSGIGGSTSYPNDSNTLYWNTITMSVTDGTSWVIGAGVLTGGTTGYNTAPNGMIHKKAATSSTSHAVLHDTSSGVSSWSQKTTSTNMFKSFTAVIELKSE